MMAQTEIAPYLGDIVGLPEDGGIGRRFQVDFYENVELASELSDERALAYLTGTSDDKGLVGGALAPLAQLVGQLSFEHSFLILMVIWVQRYCIFLKDNHKTAKKFLIDNQKAIKFLQKHNQIYAREGRLCPIVKKPMHGLDAVDGMAILHDVTLFAIHHDKGEIERVTQIIQDKTALKCIFLTS